MLSKTNSGLKSELIFPLEVAGKLSLAFQIPNLKCSHALWNWRRITDVDFYMWFSGYGKWQIYSIRTSKFYCRLSHLVTLGWLLIKHLHTELDLEQKGMAAASLGSPWAWPRPSQRGKEGSPVTPSAPHSCPPAAGVATLLPSPAVLFLPSLPSSLPGRRGRESNHRASPPRCLRRDRDRKGEVVQCVSSEGRFPGSVLLPLEVCLEMEVTVIAFSSPPPSDARLLVECPEVCFLDVGMSLWPMFRYPEWKNAIWISRRLTGGEGRGKVRWGEMTASSRLASELMPHGSQTTEHSCMAVWSH